MIEPKLRFKAFSDELSHHTLMDIIVEKPSNGIMNRQSDKVTAVKHINVIDMYTDDKIHVDQLSYSEYGDTAVEKCNVEIGDIFLTRSSVKADGIAKSNILLDDGIYVYDDHLIRLKVDKNNYIPEFVNDYLASPRFRRQFIVRAKTTAFTTIGQSDVASCTGDFPSLPEQQKIAEFLSTIDTVIEKQRETVSAWEERKKGVMQKLFSQEVRFKADDGSEFSDWEEKKIGDVFSKVKDKNKDGQNQNVITNSAEFGLINQRDFFDKDIAIDGKTENYTVIKTGDFVYNPRKSKQAPYGPFNCYQLEEDGIVSPLYTCLRTKGNTDDEYLHWYFQSGSWYRFIYENGAQNGARHDRVGMTDSLMQEIPVYLPQAVEEQQKIAYCLSALDEVIEKQKTTLAAWEEMKKGLLQQMFV